MNADLQEDLDLWWKAVKYVLHPAGRTIGSSKQKLYF